MGKQKSAAAAGAVATGPVPRPPVLEHTTAELVSLIASLSEREDFTVDILGQAFALAQQRVGISVPGATPTEPPSTNDQRSFHGLLRCSNDDEGAPLFAAALARAPLATGAASRGPGAFLGPGPGTGRRAS